MAIVNMKRFTIIGLDSEKQAILDKLAVLGTVEISAPAQVVASDDPELKLMMPGVKACLNENEIQEKLSSAKESLETLIAFDKRKKSLFTVRKNLTADEIDDFASKIEETYTNVCEIQSLKNRINLVKAEKNRLNLRLSVLKPWEDLPFDLDEKGTKNTTFVIGTIPEEVGLDSVIEQLSKDITEFLIQQVSLSKKSRYVWVIFHNSAAEQGLEILKRNNFAIVEFNDLMKSAGYNLDICKKRIAELDGEILYKNEMLSAFAERIADIEILADYYTVELEKLKVCNSMISTGNAFLIEGWVPQSQKANLEDILNQNFNYYLETRDPMEDDDLPILLDNPSFVKPFEAITEMYSLPSKKGIDPNRFMAPFYFIFFGIMLGDAGYGIILSLGTAYVLRKWGPQGTSGKITKLLCLCGISTFIWGALFGSWFGDLPKVASGGSFTINALWFNPMDDPIRMLVLSFALGAVHILTAMLLKAWMMIRDGDFMGAVYDVFSWIILLAGLVLLIPGGAAAVAGKYMAIAGTLTILLFSGRSNKNFLKRIFSGLASLYSISGYLSDILSYSRLLALGLATGVIASVVNTMGSMLGKSIVGIVLFVVLVAFGSAFNIALNVLGSFVHTSRLQYIEFFGKFYESGGRAFVPFGRKTRYVNFAPDNIDNIH